MSTYNITEIGHHLKPYRNRKWCNILCIYVGHGYSPDIGLYARVTSWRDAMAWDVHATFGSIKMNYSSSKTIETNFIIIADIYKELADIWVWMSG